MKLKLRISRLEIWPCTSAIQGIEPRSFLLTVKEVTNQVAIVLKMAPEAGIEPTTN